MSGAYLAVLLVSWAGVAALDRHWRLAAWRPRGRGRVLGVVACGATLLLAWDLVAIAEGFYGRGTGDALLGVWLAPHLPLEEVVFVVFLSHLTLVVAGAVGRALERASDRAPDVRESRQRAEAHR